LIIALIGEVRREKAEKRLPLNTQVKRVTVYAGDAKTAEIIKEGSVDIVGTCKVTNLEVLSEKGSGKELAEYPEVKFVTEYEG
jgi:valyl-tRNA synthetase